MITVMTKARTSEDRSQRRLREAAEAACRVIVESGLENTRLRDIALEAGFTTGVLTYYFPDKRSVIFEAFATAYTNWLEGNRRAFAAASGGPELLRALVDRMIPRTEAEQREWRLWVEMWAYAGTDPEFALNVLRVDTAAWEQDFVSVLGRLQAEGLIRADIDAVVEARIISRLTDGLGLRAWLANRWEEARGDLALHLGTLGVPARLVAELAV